MRDKRSIAQAQLGEELVELKSQLLAARSVLGGMVKLLDSLIEREVARGGMSPDDPLVRQYRESLAEAKRLGFSLRMPSSSDEQWQCPSCKAMLRSNPDEPLLRCPWCGYEFGQHRGGRI